MNQNLFVQNTRRSFVASSALLALPAWAQTNPPAGTVKVEKSENFKGVTQVVIGQFSVAYFTNTVNYGGNSVFSSASSARAEGELSGLSTADYQAATDAVYTEFKKLMAARGITMVDPSGYRATPMRSRVKPEAPGAPFKMQLVKADSGQGVVYWPSELGHADNVMLLVGGVSNVSNMGYTQASEKEYAKASNIPVMNVVLVVDFAAPIDTTNKMSAGGQLSADTVKATSRLAISNFGSTLSLISANDGMMFGGGQIALQTPIVEQGTFASVEGKDNNAMTRGLLAMSSGNGGMMKVNFKYMVKDPADYKAKLTAASSSALGLFLDQMQALR